MVCVNIPAMWLALSMASLQSPARRCADRTRLQAASELSLSTEYHDYVDESKKDYRHFVRRCGPASYPWRPFAPPYRSYSAASTRKTITLPDQRTLSFAQYGANDGYPVFYFHGHPGSRLEGVLLDEDARELGATLISIDRPGIGYSTPKPGRTPSELAKDVDDMATELDLKKYKILAVSGAGPYGMACARFSSERLKAVAILAGMVWLPDVGYRGMRMGNRFLSLARNYARGFLRWLVGFLSLRQLKLSDEALVDISKKQLNSRFNRMPAIDRDIMAGGSLVTQMVPSTREHFRQGVDGFMAESFALIKQLDFNVSEIDRPMALWYGKQDINVPPMIGEELAKQLGTSSSLHILDETHLSLLMKQKRRILEDLLNQL